MQSRCGRRRGMECARARGHVAPGTAVFVRGRIVGHVARRPRLRLDSDRADRRSERGRKGRGPGRNASRDADSPGLHERWCPACLQCDQCRRKGCLSWHGTRHARCGAGSGTAAVERPGLWVDFGAERGRIWIDVHAERTCVWSDIHTERLCIWIGLYP